MQHSRLSATTRVTLSQPHILMGKLLDHFSEHADITMTERRGEFALPYGRAVVEADDVSLTFHTEGDDDTGLAYMKYAVAEHVLEFAEGETPRIVWSGDGAAGSPLPYFREMRVVCARNITPHMRRVTLKGENMERFAHGGLHVRLLFPPKGVAAPQWPVTGEDGRPLWPEGENKLVNRVYTIRNIDVERGEVDIDIVIHEGDETPGSSFALKAGEGDLVGMTGPGGSALGDADWYLFAGDETALPAIGRILESLPAHVKAVVRIEVDSAAEEQDLRSDADIDVVWLHRNGQEAGTTALLADAVRAVEFPDDGTRVYAWAGCEFAAFRAIRAYIRKERKLDRQDHLVVAYWRRGLDGDNARRDKDDN
ncbi:siderophore-interacting protein [Phyllobacterium leguminum]|uniref:NADPH-dependent ferric siderophore reductase n=1 Tax=Phyllobacterium leguminum TaxID=314237 RepID=A0A318TJS4_9HYPH|nr:siderophore-interacting protein [Phyllobacterium leguminum]PYE89540.1 NADPH-dependent ferric siderophore reductase [Phyllobacterium leguminum]